MMIDSTYFCFCSQICHELIHKQTFEEKAVYLEEKIREKAGLGSTLEAISNSHDRYQGILECLQDFGPFLSQVSYFLHHATWEERVVFYQALLIDNGSLFPKYKSSNCSEKLEETQIQKALFECISTLLEVDRFYAPIGGLIGYHVEILRELQKHIVSSANSHDVVAQEKEYFPPPVFHVEDDQKLFWSFAYHGTKALGASAEFYAVGGAGDRLNLIDHVTGEPKPAACLRVLGKTLLNWLFDDIEAREFWHYKVFGKEIRVPIILMTSLEKKNDLEIEKLLEENKWFHRDPGSIFRIIQPLVPLVDQEGNWVAYEPFKLALKPGGHGAIWKLAKDFGVYKWLLEKNIRSIIVRQINNPLSGMDGALLSLLGQGSSESRSFGFASCPMRAGFHEGLNVLERCRLADGSSRPAFCLSNIEYVAFEALKKSNPQLFSGLFPANVNLLYADLTKIAESVDRNPFPGLLVNLKSDVEIQHPEKGRVVKRAARLESTMQNISDSFSLEEVTPTGKGLSSSEIKEHLPSFIQLYQRHKILSVTKRLYDSSRGIAYETPVSFLYDWIVSTRHLLESECRSRLPVGKTFEEFCASGPEFLFTFHPALGPLWNVIGQKIRNLTFHESSQVHISLSEVYIRSFEVNGVFKLEGSAITKNSMMINGHGRHHDRECLSRAYINNVRIRNKGVDTSSSSLLNYVHGTCQYSESCSIVLEGFSEVHIENVTIDGGFSLSVPNGMRAVVEQANDGTVEVLWSRLDSHTPSWTYKVEWEEGSTPKLLVKHERAFQSIG